MTKQETNDLISLTDRDPASTISPGCGLHPGIISLFLYKENTSLL